MIYAMSDIHGCLDELEVMMRYVDPDGENRIIFLGDYIDYGPRSYQVLEYLYDLQQRYGKEKVIVLKGNHEADFLEWIREYGRPAKGELDALMTFNEWLRTDMEYDGNTIRTFFPENRYEQLKERIKSSSFDNLNYDSINREFVSCVVNDHRKLIGWLKRLPSYYETDTQIFVHAGVDEEAGEGWMWGTSDDMLLSTFQAAKGHFYKDVIAGHLGTSDKKLSGDSSFHDIYHDGESHYYIDGSVYKKNGKLNMLAYDEKEKKYYSVQYDGVMKGL